MEALAADILTMASSCTGFSLLWGIGALCAGAYAIAIAVAAWRDPKYRLAQPIFNVYRTKAQASAFERFFAFTQEDMAERTVWFSRLLAPLIGAVFVVTGFFTLAAQVRCANIGNEFLSITHLQFRAWLPVWPFTLVASAIGFVNAQKRKLRTPFVALTVALTAVFGFCGAEAAAYHVGEMANRWATAAIIALFASLVPSGIDWITKRRTQA